jgi:RimJ/RimL family protein N-acetyltransferase
MEAWPEVALREVIDADLPILFQHQRDPEANAQAAFGAADPDDRSAFEARWQRIRVDPSIVTRTVLADGEVVGSILRWRDEDLDAPEVSYWIGRQFWGRGIASRALVDFLDVLPDRRLYGRVSSTNPASVRVLRKAGFRLLRTDVAVQATDGRTVDELILVLER